MSKLLSTILILVITTGGLMAQDSLGLYLKTAFENNPTLQSSYEGFAVMLDRADQAGYLPDPTLTTGIFLSPVETRVGPQRMRFSLSQMFPWFGTLQARQDQMDKQAEAAFWQYANTARMITRDVRSLYYDLWVTRELIEVQKENLLLIKSLESLATTRFRSGEGRLAEVLRVQLDQKAAQNALERQQELLDSKSEQFFLLLNIARDSLYLPDTVVIDLPPAIENDSLTNHPLIQASLAKSASANAFEEVAKKQGFPSMGVGLDYIIISKRDDMVMDDNGKNAFAPMFTIGLPIYRKKYGAMKSEARAMQRQFQMEAKSEQNKLFSTLTQLEFTIRRSLEDLELYNEQVDLAETMLSLSRTDFASDRTDFDEILDYQDKLLEYRRDKLMAYGELLKAMTAYDYITGDQPSQLIEEDYEKDK